MIWFNFDCIMQLKKSYHIATNVCSRNSATTFGWWSPWLVRFDDPFMLPTELNIAWVRPITVQARYNTAIDTH